MDVFNTPVSRKGTYCTQWDFCEDRFGVKDVLPFSISDIRLIHEGKVGIMAGHVYGTEGEGYLRLNLACGREKLYMGLTRLVSVIKNINQGE